MKKMTVIYGAAALFFIKKLPTKYVRSSAVGGAALLPSTCFWCAYCRVLSEYEQV
jgi:hypothetical protein